MKKQILGKNLKVSAVSLGCMGMTHAYGAPSDVNEMSKLIAQAVDIGYTMLDTAECYTGTNPDGSTAYNEELVGKALRPYRDKVIIASKFGVQITAAGLHTNSRPSTIRKSIEGSLERLGTDDIVFRAFDNGKHIGDTKGKDGIQTAFDSFAKQFLTLYHMNGEKLFDIDGEQASGTTYCQVTLRFEKDRKTFQTQQGLRYQNKYVKVSGEWKIKEMSSDIIWRETHEVI